MTAISFYLLPLAHQLSWAMLLLSIGLGFAYFCNVPMYSFNNDLFSKGTGTAQGIMMSCFSLAGIVSPSLTGWLVEKTHSYSIAIWCISSLSLISGLLAFGFHRVREKTAS
jgi:predicted MFS family arabinose efflux permease